LLHVFLKFAHLILDKLPEAQVYEYFIDMRSFGKGYEEFYERIKEEGVPSSVVRLQRWKQRTQLQIRERTSFCQRS